MLKSLNLDMSMSIDLGMLRSKLDTDFKHSCLNEKYEGITWTRKKNYDITLIRLQAELIENGFFLSRSNEAGGPYVLQECKFLWSNW